MREHKYRAWDEEINRMVFPYLIDFNIGWAYYFDDKNETQRVKVSNLLQFTGLRDTKEIDVYEGDLMRHGVYGIGEVMLENGCYIIKFIPGTGELPPRENPHSIYLCYVASKERVIGNRYENPELIKELRRGV